MINNINSYNGNYNINSSPSSSSSEVDKIIEDHNKSSVTAGDAVSNVNENLYLSSRAKKINAISTEFFNNGAISFNDVDALKERAYQLGLISKQEYAHLNDSGAAVKDTSLNEEMSSQTLANFASDFVERLDATDTDATESESETESQILLALKDAFTAASKILSDVDTAKNSPDFKESLASTLSTIRETINSDSFEIIPLDDKVAMTKVYQALEIVDKMSESRLSNAKINRYIQVSFN
ncbi:MAG: hypothetical protein ACJAXJ_004236 [Colwellia sp.]|jgi:hypothetical protein|tara:strand:+ start:23130 stop:23846 length:717 start_codon:yes stop_codon:yes gene_type:complete